MEVDKEIKKVEVKPSRRTNCTYEPACVKDQENFLELSCQVDQILIEHGLHMYHNKGLYIAAKTNTGPLGVMMDHEPGLNVPDEVHEFLNKVKVEVVK